MSSSDNSEQYSAAFYEEQKDRSRRSAENVVPVVCEMVNPRSVVDFGCGLGTWLSVFRDLGIEDIRGYDGPWLPQSGSMIPPDRFVVADLDQPIHCGREFSLGLCLEVAEHLPASSAPVLIDSLVRSAPAVLFSAARPGQGGTHHVNERWPNYWAKLFAGHGWLCFDVVRPYVFREESVDHWYRMNTFLYCSPSSVLVRALRRRNRSLIFRRARINARSGYGRARVRTRKTARRALDRLQGA